MLRFFNPIKNGILREVSETKLISLVIKKQIVHCIVLTLKKHHYEVLVTLKQIEMKTAPM
jgi:hypothetical protein